MTRLFAVAVCVIVPQILGFGQSPGTELEQAGSDIWRHEWEPQAKVAADDDGAAFWLRGGRANRVKLQEHEPVAAEAPGRVAESDTLVQRSGHVQRHVVDTADGDDDAPLLPDTAPNLTVWTIPPSAQGVLEAVGVVSLDGTSDVLDHAQQYDGHGALSAGASSRLLWDYSEPQRSEILDLLFKPKYGASLQMLKVEIGGDTQSTDGAEASHMHSNDDLDCDRGYEFWLLREAKKRNPSLLTSALAWGAPGWISDAVFPQGYYSQANIQYHVKWLRCVQSTMGFQIDFLGIWNERRFELAQVPYVKSLAHELRSNNLTTQLVALDGWITDEFLQVMKSDHEFAGSFDVVGLHYPCSAPNAPEIFRAGKKLWASEEVSTPAAWEAGGGCLGRLNNQNFVRFGSTSTTVWAVIWSAYANLGCFGHGMMYAHEPWSGHYEVKSPIWTMAHTTQFAEPGWKYLPLKSGSGFLPEGGTFVTLVNSQSGDFSVVVETLVGSCGANDGCRHQPADAVRPQTVYFRPQGLLAGNRTLRAWRTTAQSWFERLPDIVLLEGGLFALTIAPDTITTITTTSGQSKAGSGDDDVKHPSTALALRPVEDHGVLQSEEGTMGRSRFPLPYSESFDTYSEGAIPRFIADQGGAFEVHKSGPSGVLRQMVPTRSIEWLYNWGGWNRRYPVFTTVGDPDWRDYAVEVQGRLLAPGDSASGGPQFVALCGRMLTFAAFADDVPAGYCLNVTQSSWDLSIGMGAVKLANGTMGGFFVSDWQSLRLEFQGSRIVAYLNGETLAHVVDTQFPAGQVGLASGRHHAEFDNLHVSELEAASRRRPFDGEALISDVQLTAVLTKYSTHACPTNPVRVPLRRDFDGFLGATFRVTSAKQVKELGRFVATGNSQLHNVSLIDGGTWTVVASAAIDPAAGPELDGFAWTAVAPVTLVPGRQYFLVSFERSGGDYFYDWTVSGDLSSAVDSLSPVWAGKDANSHSWQVVTDQLQTPHMYGPVNVWFAKEEPAIIQQHLQRDQQRREEPLHRSSAWLAPLFGSAVLVLLQSV
mmetsp:Transcript_2290/g.5261  ORF Transcript_2290/g.5261 Transcript_2290/m.5261 type:complete len:1043 (-) Transcript_2290:14-3142(-)